MRRSFVVLSTLLLVLIFFGCGLKSELNNGESETAQDNLSWTQPELEQFSLSKTVSFSVPSNWRSSESENESYKCYYWYPYESNDLGIMYVFVSELDTDLSEIPADSYFKVVFKQAVTDELEEYEEISISGTVAYYASFIQDIETNDNVLHYDTRAYGFISDGSVYIFEFGMPNALNDEMNDFSEEIISSIKIEAESDSNNTAVMETEKSYELDFDSSPVLYSDDNITIKYAHSSLKNNSQLEVYFYVQNNSEVSLTIQADAISVNGYCFSNIVMSDTVVAGSIGIVDAKIQEYDSELVGNVFAVGGQLRYFDEIINSTIKETALLTQTNLDDFSQYSISSSPSGDCLYSNDDVEVYFKNAERSQYDNDRAELYLYFVNKTDSTIMIQCDAVTINGFSFSNTVVSDYVTPQATGIVNITVQDMDPDMVGIDSIETIGGQFRIIDPKNISDTYKISF